MILIKVYFIILINLLIIKLTYYFKLISFSSYAIFCILRRLLSLALNRILSIFFEAFSKFVRLIALINLLKALLILI